MTDTQFNIDLYSKIMEAIPDEADPHAVIGALGNIMVQAAVAFGGNREQVKSLLCKIITDMVDLMAEANPERFSMPLTAGLN
jgi:hypothetical protein